MRTPWMCLLLALPAAVKADEEAEMAAYEALLTRSNVRYAAVCEQWWKDGPFHAWLLKYGTYFQEVAAAEKMLEPAILDNYKVFSIEAGSYRSTADLKAARDFLNRARTVFFKREAGPYEMGDV